MKKTVIAAVALVMTAGVAAAGNSNITRKDGSRVNVVTTGAGSTATVYNASGKRVSSQKYQHKGSTQHKQLVKTLAQPGDKVRWGR